MPSLECRHSSSEEDLLSTDDLDSVTDPEGVPYEEYAITFDLPGNSYSFYVLVIFTTRMANSKFILFVLILPFNSFWFDKKFECAFERTLRRFGFDRQ